MKPKLFKICISLLLLLMVACYGINSETSQIGDINSTCQSKNAWEKIVKEYSTDKIKDSSFIEGLEGYSTDKIKDSSFIIGLKEVQNHFIKPEYILYFENGPKEIIGCDWNSVRVAYNPNISASSVNGLSSELSDEEQVRIRNRVLKLLYQYECPEGKKILLKEMKKPAIFGKEYYKNK